MNSFRNHRLRDLTLPTSTTWLLTDIAEAKGKQKLYTLRGKEVECLGRGHQARWRRKSNG